jgi:hypothetical protein
MSIKRRDTYLQNHLQYGLFAILTLIFGSIIFLFLSITSSYSYVCKYSCPLLTDVAVYKRYTPGALVPQYFPLVGLNISIPSDWVRSQTAQAINELSSYVSPIRDQSDRFQENILIKYGRYLHNVSAVEFNQASLRALEKVPNFQLVQRDDNFALGDSQANRIVYSYSENNVPYTALQVSANSGSGFITITYKAELGKYAEYLPAVEQILKSVKINWQILNKPSNGSLGSLENWNVGNEGYLSSIFSIFSSLDNSSDMYYDNIRIFMQPVGYAKANETSETRSNVVEKLFQKSLIDFKVLERKSTTVSAYPAFSLTYTFKGKDGIDHKIQRIETIRGGREYIIYYDSTPFTFNQYIPVLNQVISAIRFY